MQQPPSTAWTTLPPQRGGAALRAFALDPMARAVAALLVVALLGALILGSIVGRLVPADLPATGKQVPIAHVRPAFQDTPARVDTNGNPLKVVLRATATRVDAGYTATRFVFVVDPPNDARYTLCDGAAPVCTLALDGTRLQNGTWIVTVQAYDNTGASAAARTRVRVT